MAFRFFFFHCFSEEEEFHKRRNAFQDFLNHQIGQENYFNHQKEEEIIDLKNEISFEKYVFLPSVKNPFKRVNFQAF